LKLPIDAFYRESRSGVKIAKHNITTGLFGLQDFEAERKNWPSTRFFVRAALFHTGN
jgi:hypothetical protein